MRDEDRNARVSRGSLKLTVVFRGAAMLVLVSAASAQIITFGQRPKVPVTIKHPASLGITLAGKKVAFGPVTGSCPQEFTDLVMQDFVKQGVTLVTRADL